MMAEKMGRGGWHIQIDCDEYFVDFGGFKNYLLALNPCPSGKEKPYNVLVGLCDLYKKVQGGYLIVDAGRERPFTAPFATTRPEYLSAKQSGHFNRLSPFYVIHETWSRGIDELRFKLENWGHSSAELKEEKVRESYIKLWEAIDAYNFQFVRDFHFAVPYCWHQLQFVKASNMEDLLKKFKPEFNINPTFLWIANLRIYGKLRQILDKLKFRLT
jgi:hypothetical protein